MHGAIKVGICDTIDIMMRDEGGGRDFDTVHFICLDRFLALGECLVWYISKPRIHKSHITHLQAMRWNI